MLQRLQQFRETDMSASHDSEQPTADDAIRGGRGRELSPVERVLSEQMWSKALRLQRTAYSRLIRFWEALAERSIDLHDVYTTGLSVMEVTAKIDNLFINMLKIDSESASILRAYADFLFNLRNNPSKYALRNSTRPSLFLCRDSCTCRSSFLARREERWNASIGYVQQRRMPSGPTHSDSPVRPPPPS